MIQSHVVMRLSSPGKDVTETSVEESSDDCKPKNVHHEFLQFYTHRAVCKKLTPLVSRPSGSVDGPAETPASDRQKSAGRRSSPARALQAYRRTALR